MPRRSVDDLLDFIQVARELSFTRAAAKLGVSPSALSHSIRGLEERLGLRLLTRSTRSVTLTAAGDRLLQSIGPRLDEIDAEVAALGELRNKPAGVIRITVDEHGFNSALWPSLRQLGSVTCIRSAIRAPNGGSDETPCCKAPICRRTQRRFCEPSAPIAIRARPAGPSTLEWPPAHGSWNATYTQGVRR